jgi:hypothetical protein
MGDRPAPERRRAADGTWEVRVRDRWLPAEDAGTLAAWNEWQDGVERAARMLGGKPPAPELERRTGPNSTPQVRIDGKWIAESMVAVWEAYERLRSIKAVALELGMDSSSTAARLKWYEEVFGVTRPPAIDAKPARKPGPSARFDRRGEPPPQGHPFRASVTAAASDRASDPVSPTGRAPAQNVAHKITAPVSSERVADAAHNVSTERHDAEHEHQWGAWADPEHTLETCVVDGCDATRLWGPLAASSDAGAEHASDMHREPASWRNDAQADSWVVISIDATIPVAEMASWSPDRIRALFEGVATVHRALGEVGS